MLKSMISYNLRLVIFEEDIVKIIHEYTDINISYLLGIVLSIILNSDSLVNKGVIIIDNHSRIVNDIKLHQTNELLIFFAKKMVQYNCNDFSRFESLIVSGYACWINSISLQNDSYDLYHFHNKR